MLFLYAGRVFPVGSEDIVLCWLPDVVSAVSFPLIDLVWRRNKSIDINSWIAPGQPSHRHSPLDAI